MNELCIKIRGRAMPVRLLRGRRASSAWIRSTRIRATTDNVRGSGLVNFGFTGAPIFLTVCFAIRFRKICAPRAQTCLKPELRYYRPGSDPWRYRYYQASSQPLTTVQWFIPRRRKRYTLFLRNAPWYFLFLFT